jgi:N-acetylneuraminic acid mutarotase
VDRRRENLIEGRFRHTATLLADGRVLVAGGTSRGGALASAELYDPNTQKWSLTGNMAAGRASYAAAVLSDGTVLVVGGCSCGSGDLIVVASAEVFGPDAGSWTATGGLHEGRFLHSATLLVDGRVLVTGGERSGFGATSSAEVYDPG